jgi:predicted peptidase
MKKIIYLAIFIILFCIYFIWKNKEKMRDDYQKKDSTEVADKIDDDNKVSIFDPNQPVKYLDSLEEKPIIPKKDNKIHSWIATKKFSYPTDSFKAYIFNGMPFRLAYPNNYKKGSKKYPIIFLFHGNGEMGEAYDNESQLFNGANIHLEAIKTGAYDGFLIFPQVPGAWFDKQIEKLNLLVNLLADSVDIDLNRVVAHGLSRGGVGALGFAKTYPKTVAAILPMGAVGGWQDGKNLKYVPMWVFQGERDSKSTKTYTEYEIDRLVKDGANIKYTLYPKLGHKVWDKAYEEKDFFNYINNAHKANPIPFGGKTSFNKGIINTTLFIAPGFDNYEWRRNGVLISGENKNILKIDKAGSYDCRILRDKEWSSWSLKPVVISN